MRSILHGSPPGIGIASRYEVLGRVGSVGPCPVPAAATAGPGDCRTPHELEAQGAKS